ncbi:unnamed protein product [Owenia fusiformis]|uniref:Uncharacterized protein n=1 Tax=Owenia fusiformis TaxID=6347 RepID=A0A8J1TZU1_OWEFU|nr:unnamed protein product [Owenia fusiformis]
MTTEVIMPTIKERETLMKEDDPNLSGFHTRPAQKLVKKHLPKTMVNIECSHLLRNDREETTHGNSALEYRLWLEAGKHKPPFPNRPDPQYNSNVWRNFRKHYGFKTNTDGQNISEMIGSMYPINIPAPSKVGKYTFGKFLTETPSLIADERSRKLAIKRTNCDVTEFKRLRLRSESRNPPMDQTGNILPPTNYKKYDTSFTPPPDITIPPPKDYSNTRLDIFGRRTPVKTRSLLWSLHYDANNPKYDEVIEDIRRRKSLPKQHPPAITDKHQIMRTLKDIDTGLKK